MPVDVSYQIGAVKRELTRIEKNGEPAWRILATRDYDTDAKDLWDALTTVERIPRWFLPIEGELKVGGRFQLKGNAGGSILSCDPPRRFEITWEMHGQVSWVNVDLFANANGGTQLQLEHIAHVPDEFWQQYGPGAVGVGWESGLLGLDQHFFSANPIKPEDGVAWLSSPEGKAFVRGSSEGWYHAAIAAGIDPALARAAADRTTAAYTGGGDPG
jgi:uncharacterized protein YndB with AHSA1/START domain